MLIINKAQYSQLAYAVDEEFVSQVKSFVVKEVSAEAHILQKLRSDKWINDCIHAAQKYMVLEEQDIVMWIVISLFLGNDFIEQVQYQQEKYLLMNDIINKSQTLDDILSDLM